MLITDRLRTYFRRTLRGLWLSRAFRKLWLSLTITSFGAQITNLALPLTAALLLHASPMQMGILVALETLPFAMFSLHAGVLLDRVRKLPVVIATDIGRGLALLAIPVAAWFDALSVELLFGIGFLCGVQNVVGGAAYQVLLAQMAGRKRLVEANAKISLGETSAALIGPGMAGGLIQALTAPFAIALDAVTFFISALMLRRLEAKNDVVHGTGAASMWREIGEGLKLVWENRTLWGLAWLAGLWQFLHHMQIAVLILFATRDLSLSAGAIGIAYAFGGLGCVLASAFAERLSSRLGIGPVIVHALRHRPGLAGIRPARGLGVGGDARAGARHACFRLRGGSLRHQLSGAASGDHAGPAARAHDGDDALPDRRAGAARLAMWRCAGDGYRLARNAAHGRGARIGAGGGGGDVVARAAAPATACACGRLAADVKCASRVRRRTGVPPDATPCRRRSSSSPSIPAATTHS